MSPASTPGPRVRDALHPTRPIGPLLYLHGAVGGRLELAALLALSEGRSPPDLEAGGSRVAAECLGGRLGYRVWRYRFALPARADAGYRLAGERYPVQGELAGDLRLAYVSCNGQEEGDRDRPAARRNALWRRLAESHRRAPFQILLHGGDQLYADEMLQVHPQVRAWARGRGLDTAAAPEVGEALRDELFGRYLEVLGQPEFGWLAARVPSLAMWDDHDICDGWGSLPERQLDSPVGRRLFAAAREMFLLFQMGCGPDEQPGICVEAVGQSLTWAVALPGLDLVAPDLRSERRPDQVMGQAGWRALGRALAQARQGRLLLLSSVPALGPRLSWVEALLHLLPRLQNYEDDLRDQWQSRAHRAEWRRFLEALLEVHARGVPVTVLSGEIHLATRGWMDTAAGPLHQLVASGVAHPPPPGLYARALGLLASLGESPVPEHPVRLAPLPGRRGIYTAERNYLVLERRQCRWRASWELEDSGASPALPL